jgi:SPW repeat
MKQSIMRVTIGAGDDGKPCGTVGAVLSDDWQFWAVASIILVVAAAGSGRYRAAAARLRRSALERRLVEAGPGRRIDAEAGGFWSDLSWLIVLIGVWVAISPWIWGYDDSGNAVRTDVITGGLIVLLTLAGVVLPALNALSVFAGMWLAVAPWFVGYGDDRGPVGLSDTVAGLAVVALALATLASASRRVSGGASMPIGRFRRGPE